MYTSLKIVKKLPFAWIYYPNGLSTGFAVSKGYFTADEATGLFQIVEQGKTKRPEVLLENIVVQDESAGGPNLTFSTFVELQQKLSELGNPLMNAISTGSNQLSSDELEAVQNSNNPSATNTFVTLDDISSILPDVLLESTGYILVGQDLTFNAFWKCRINNTLYSNPIPVLKNIPLCGAGLFRYDVFVLNTSNTFNRIQGDESSSNIIEPNILPNTVLACTVLVTDSSVGEPIPGITGEEFVKKQESVDFIVDYGATLVINQIDLVDDRSSLSIVNAVTDIKSIQVSEEFLRPGKPFFVKNKTGHNITLWHLASGFGNIRFLCPNAINLIVKSDEIMPFKLNGNDSSDYKIEYIGSDLSDKESSANKVTTMIGNTTSNIVFLSAKAIYDWSIANFQSIETFNQSRWQFSDFTNANANQGPFIGVALASGTLGSSGQTSINDINSLGAVILNSSASANSGYRMMDAGGMVWLPRAEITFLGKFGLDSNAAGRDRITRIGFHSTQNHVAPLNGVYLEVLGNIASFKTTSGGVTTSSSSVTLNDAFTGASVILYSVFVTFIADRTARCVLYNSAMTALLTITFTPADNMPVLGSRFNSGIITTITTAGAIANICQVDYMGVGIAKPSFLNNY